MAKPITPFPISCAQINDKSTAAEMRQHFIKDLRAQHKFLRDVSNELWVYKDGRYIPASKEWTFDRCTELVSELYHGHIVLPMIEAVHAHLKARQPYLQAIPPSYKVNLKNGLWNVRTSKLESHSPSAWPSFVQIPAIYDPQNSTA